MSLVTRGLGGDMRLASAGLGLANRIVTRNLRWADALRPPHPMLTAPCREQKRPARR